MLRRIAGSVLIFGSLVIGATNTASSRNAPRLVRLQSGLVQGVVDDGLAVDRGSPLAAPPVGNLRWRAPQPPAVWAGTLDTTAFKPACMQKGPTLPGMMEQYNEDCLYLNIWTPEKKADQRLAV